MNTEFLKTIGIEDSNPRVILEKLDAKEEELYNKRDLAESANSYERVKEIDELLGKLEIERDQVKAEAEKMPASDDAQNDKEKNRDQEIKNQENEILGRINRKKQEEAKEKESEVSKLDAVQAADLTKKSNVKTSSSSNVSASSKKANTPAKQSKPQPAKAASVAGASPASPSSTAGGNSNYSKGLQYYQKQDYVNAFQCLFAVAEEKKPVDQKTVQEQTKACYLVSMMYRNGLGQKQDLGRGIHYLKRAADFGYDQAQYEYGVSTLSRHMKSTDADLKARKEGLEYIEKAADSGLVDAMKKYVDFAINSSDSNLKIIDKAKQYIPVLNDHVDSYEASKYKGFLDSLTEAEKNAKKQASYPRKYVIGELLFLLGAIYLFKGLNKSFFEGVLPVVGRFFPNIPDFLIIKWKQLTEITDPHMTHQGIFGCWLIILGNIIRGLGVKQVIPESGSSKLKVFGRWITVLIVLICILNLFANAYETYTYLGDGGDLQIVAFFGSIIVGRIIGTIMYKIIK